jgi:hypothetical protein
LAVNADNALANDKQKSTLASLDNSFEEENSARCFNHTLQLSGKALLVPFNPALSAKSSDLEDFEDDSEIPELVPNEDSDSEADEDEVSEDFDDAEDEGDEMQELNEQERMDLLATTAVVRETVTKASHSLPLIYRSCLTLFHVPLASQLRKLSFSIIHSTTIALPAWHHACEANKLKVKLMPRDVVTRWNSTYDMMTFALAYRKPIDQVTADKKLKLRRYELDTEDWQIVDDLVSVLEACSVFLAFMLH